MIRLKGRVFEIVRRSGFKPFWHLCTPKRLQKALLERHLNNLCDFPTTLSIEITNICNAKCWFCPQPLSTRKKGYMDFSLYCRIMDEVSLNARKVKSIALFMDGEPTLHKELLKFLSYAHELEIENIYLSSNMEFFSPQLTNSILDANLGKTLQYVICSLDGATEQTYSKNRIGVDFRKAVYNTEYLIEQRNLRKQIYPRIFSRLLVSDLTKDELAKFKKYWKGKADKTLCYKMHNWGGQITDARMSVSNNGSEFIPCYFPFSQFAIQYDGTVRLCCVDANSSIIIGDTNKQSIKQIWNNEAINEIRKCHLNREIDKTPSICADCSYPRKGTWIAPFYWG